MLNVNALGGLSDKELAMLDRQVKINGRQMYQFNVKLQEEILRRRNGRR